MCCAIAGTLASRCWSVVSCRPLRRARPTDPGAAVLAKEVAGLGWILFSAKTAQGDYDLFLSRPDGSAQRNLTQTPDANEFGGRFSPDSKWMLYRRQHRNATQASGKEVNHDLWGTQGALVIAKADGSDPQPQGEEGALSLGLVESGRQANRLPLQARRPDSHLRPGHQEAGEGVAAPGDLPATVLVARRQASVRDGES